MEFLGIPISVGELLVLGTAIVTAIAGYHKLVQKVEHISEKLEDQEMEQSKRVEEALKALEHMKMGVENRFSPLESQVRAQESNYASISATLISLQNNLSSISGRLDTIITQMLERNK